MYNQFRSYDSKLKLAYFTRDMTYESFRPFFSF